ncbi:uncharacterized protein LTR77_000081 [Saxophila tyrrhenica]|uniref:Enoyl reductase (ER) domain-containing protein n=1 Tax=Saxophila tyrrhenica TaxID=1690608 RepID=A0AAV9PN28_9PEZI|nr:hypothetical protein LTR77_000081 [Saxophila tyrrhenica]
MSTHPAVVTVTPGGPLQIQHIPTPPIASNQVKLINQYTASTPLDLHQADAHLLVNPPQILGDSVAGTVLEVGPDVKRLRPGDQVFGFVWRFQAEKAHQLYVVTEEKLLAKLPPGRSLQEVVVVPDNFVTAWHALSKDLGFDLPWPKPEGYVSPGKDSWIVVWGGSSSVGMYAIQILRYYGYGNVVTTASKAHHERLVRYGASVCLDYRDEGTVERIRDRLKSGPSQRDFVLDCIGSLEGSVRPLARVATTKGAKVAILLPVIIKDAAPGIRPEYEMDVQACAAWAQGVEVSGVRTHTYMTDEFLAERLQPEMMPWAIAEKTVEPNDQIIVEGGTLLERAERALQLLREKKVSGGRLVWRVAEEEEVKTAMEQFCS